MVEFLGKKLDAANDNLLPGDFVEVTNWQLKKIIAQTFGQTRLRVAQVQGQTIDIVAARDYTPNMSIIKKLRDPEFGRIKHCSVQAGDIKKISVRFVD